MKRSLADLIRRADPPKHEVPKNRLEVAVGKLESQDLARFLLAAVKEAKGRRLDGLLQSAREALKDEAG